MDSTNCPNMTTFFHTDMLVDTAMDLKLGLIKAVMGNFVSSALFHFNLGIWDPIS